MFSNQEKLKLQEGLDKAIECSALAMRAADTDFRGCQKLLEAFFARPEDLPRLKAGLQKMHNVITDPSRVITFVDARGQSEKLLRFCEREVPGVAGRANHGAKEMILESTRIVPMGPGDYAYVKTLKNHDATAPAEAHSGSGMRVYIGERGFHPSKNIRDTAATVYHEIDHKVLGTVDHAYKVPDCSALATSDKAIQCADSWSLFVTAMMFRWDDLDWDPADLSFTRARSNAVSTPSPGRPRSNAITGPPPVKPGSSAPTTWVRATPGGTPPKR